MLIWIALIPVTTLNSVTLYDRIKDLRKTVEECGCVYEHGHGPSPGNAIDAEERDE